MEHVDRPGIAGAVYMHDGTSSLWIDAQSPTSRYQRTLERAFPGQTVRITSHTRDGGLLLAVVFSDRNPGEFYVYDTAAKKVLPSVTVAARHSVSLECPMHASAPR